MLTQHCHMVTRVFNNQAYSTVNNSNEPDIELNESSASAHFHDPAVISFIDSSNIALEISLDDLNEFENPDQEADDSIDNELSGIRDRLNETSRQFDNFDSDSSSSLELDPEEKKERRRAKLFRPTPLYYLRSPRFPEGFFKESRFRDKVPKTFDSTDDDVAGIKVEIPIEEVDVFDEDENQPIPTMSFTQEDYERLLAENAAIKKKNEELQTKVTKRMSLANTTAASTSDGTGPGPSGVTAALLMDVIEINNETLSENIAKQFAIHSRQSRGGGDGSRDFVPQPSCLTIPQRHFHLKAKNEQLVFPIEDCRSLLVISPVQFSSTDNTGSKKNVKQICEGARVTKWKAGDDYRTVEEFLIEFENEIRQLVKTNQEYNLCLDYFLEHTDLINYKKALQIDEPWHLNAIKLVKQFSTIMNHQLDIEEFKKEVKNEHQSVVDFCTFWLRRMRWNTSVTPKWVAQVLTEKIGKEYREIFKETEPTDTIEEIIEAITEMENSGTANKRSVNAKSYYNQVAKPLIDKVKSSSSSKSSSNSKSDSNSSKSNSSGENRSNAPPKKENPFTKFDKGQILKRFDRNGRAQFTKVASANEINFDEPGLTVHYVDMNHNLQPYDRKNPPNFEEFSVCDISISLEDLNLN
ncbi:unnamed protein product [Allacma fusca]|uniref:Uncharacterized protein n=1 Tax=Allacma fusca TaxID=39272 RepID=A0A8J2PYN1_9HEXA|nr:unnamed protein product [Allacma fusca]